VAHGRSALFLRYARAGAKEDMADGAQRGTLRAFAAASRVAQKKEGLPPLGALRPDLSILFPTQGV